MHKPQFPVSRRNLLQSGAALAATTAMAGVSGLTRTSGAADAPEPVPAVSTAPSGDRWRGLKVGITTYTFKQRPLEPTIEAMKRVDLHFCSIKDFHLPLKSTADQRKEVAQKFRDNGIVPLSCGVITLKNDEADVRQAFEYARDAGIPTIVCSPAVESIPLLEKFVKEFDIRLAIHNHGPEDKKWPSPNEVIAAVAGTDDRIGLCIDVGHTARAGVDPATAIRKFRSRVFDIHFKDIESLQPKAKPTEVGRGVLDVRGMLQALLDIGFSRQMSFEFEKDLTTDPLPGLAESVGYVRGVLASLRTA